MAVQNKYVDTNVEAGDKANSAFAEGAKTLTLLSKFEVVAADSDGSIFRLAKGIPPNWIIKRIEIMNDAIQSGTNYVLGLYKSRTDTLSGTVLNSNVLMGIQNFSAVHLASAKLDGLSAVLIDDRQKKIFELAGDVLTSQQIGYDIALKTVVAGVASGTIFSIVEVVEG